MKKVKIPDQLFVTFNKTEVREWPILPDGSYDYSNPIVTHKNVGFLNHYSNDKAGLKRQQTQMEWAYGQEINPAIRHKNHGWWKDHNDVMWHRTSTWNATTRSYNHTESPIEPEYVPKIWDNVPLSGFKIVDYNSRYSTSNKLIVVEDPRGGEFEVKIEAFVELIQKVTVINGVIQDKCLWQANKVLIRG